MYMDKISEIFVDMDSQPENIRDMDSLWTVHGHGLSSPQGCDTLNFVDTSWTLVRHFFAPRVTVTFSFVFFNVL